MKIIKYKFLSAEINHGTEKEHNIEQVLIGVEVGWNEANEEIAKKEAYNGYTIEDDGAEEILEPTELDKLDARLTYVEMMSGLLEV